MPTLVELVPYDPDWPKHYLAAEMALKLALGPAVLAVDHVGSTAIPCMSAKPIIDIDITLSGPADIPGASETLVSAGYEPRGNRYQDDVWAFILRSHLPQLRVYLCPPANRTHHNRVLFRDYLRNHQDAATAYSALKRHLADQFPYDGDRYTSEKTQFVQEIVRRASERGLPMTL